MSHSPHRLVHFTPLRYPGGKGKLARFVKAIIEKNSLEDGHYCEPYAGGAAVAIDLLLNEYVSRVHINDISRPIFAFWSSLLNDTEAFCRKIHGATLTVRAWDRHKKILANPDDHDDLALGFATFFLNRTCRSGILNGGIIGGRDQTGGWLIDARYNAKALIQRIEAIAVMRDRIAIYNEDADALLRRLLPELPLRTLFYLDPPYYLKGKQLYMDFYGEADHAIIAARVAAIEHHRWMVSYDDVPQVRLLYAAFSGISYELNYTAREVAVGREVMYFSDNLVIPEPNRLLQKPKHIPRRPGAVHAAMPSRAIPTHPPAGLRQRRA